MVSWDANADVGASSSLGDTLAVAHPPDARPSVDTRTRCHFEGGGGRAGNCLGRGGDIGVILAIPAWMLADDLRDFSLPPR